MSFHVQISLCTSEQLVVFFWSRQDHQGTGGTDIYTFLRSGEIRVRIVGALRDVFLMRSIGDGY